MSSIFDFGIKGFPLSIDNNSLLVTCQPSGNVHIYKYGSTGRAIYVDDAGRLLVALTAPSGFNYKKEDLSSQINGSGNVFQIFFMPVSGTLKLFWNGLLLRDGTGYDFVLNNREITTNFIPFVGNSLIGEYFY